MYLAIFLIYDKIQKNPIRSFVPFDCETTEQNKDEDHKDLLYNALFVKILSFRLSDTRKEPAVAKNCSDGILKAHLFGATFCMKGRYFK